MSEPDLVMCPEDLEADANHWDEIAGVIGDAVGVIMNDTMLTSDVIDGISKTFGFKVAYDAAREQVFSFLCDGKFYLGSIGPTLREICTSFEATDEATVLEVERITRDR